MTFIELTTHTAPAAQRCIRSFPALPAARLRPSHSSIALASMQDKEHTLIHAITTRITTHLTEVAAFAAEVERVDAHLGEVLAP